MSIRQKTLLIISLTVVILATALILSSRFVIQESFNDLEEKYFQRNLDLVSSIVDDMLGRLVYTAADWATWDDTYAFVSGKNTRYVTQNLEISALVNLQVNFMLFYDRAAKLVYAACADLNKKELVSVPPDIIQGIIRSGIVTPVDRDTVGRSGICMSGETPFFVAARSIVKSDGSGPPAGMMIIGRYFDSTHVAYLSDLMHMGVSVAPITGQSLSQKDQSILEELVRGKNIVLRSLNSDSVNAFGLLRDITGKPALLLQVTMPRDIYRHGQDTVLYTVIWLLIISCIFAIVIIVMLERNVLFRLSWLSTELGKLRKRSDLSQRLPSMGADEFGRLSNDINGFIQSLQESQQRLQTSERRYYTLFNEMVSGFGLHEMICDEKGAPVDYRFLEVNPAFERLTGLKREYIVGKTVKEVIPEIEHEWISKYGIVAITGDSVHFESYNRGLNRHFEVIAFSPAKGQIAVTFTDVTERKKAEEEREKIYAQLLHAQKMEAIGIFAGGIAHDFNNLLCAIHGYADLLRHEKGLTLLIEKGLTIIYEASSKGTNLIKQLLTFSRKTPVILQPVNLNQQIGQTAKLLERLIPRMISLELKCEQGLDIINADANQIEQIVMNLAINARDAMPDGGTLTIETKNIFIDETFSREHTFFKEGNYVQLSVADTGCGIRKKDIKHIFEPFYTTKEAGKGTGLGLATVYGIVKNHDGFILCESGEGAGTVFNIYFPAIDVNVPAVQLESFQDLPLGKETILIIDDEPYVCDFMTTLLKNYGYTVISELDGDAGIIRYRHDAGRIGLVVLDMVMPSMSGKVCLEEIMKINPEAQVIIVSGYATDDQLQITLQAGAKDFIRKPFDKTLLLRTIRDVLDKKK